MFNLKTMNKLAIFDLDNTLLNGDSDRNWGLFLAEKSIVDDNYLRESEKFYDNYYQGSLDIDGFLSFCLKPLVANSLELLINLRMEYIETKIKPIMLSKAKSEILLRKKDSEVIIATATNDFITRPIADLFDVEYLIATEFEIVDNKFTGNANTTFYSDSFNDLPLLEAINKPIVVDGDDKLIEEAKKNGWQYISFR